jgi:hypothetical protein
MLTFSNITPAVFEAVLNELRKSSTVTDWGPTGPVHHYGLEGSGVKARVLYSATRELTEVHIEDKPFYVSETMIGSKIRNAIDAAQAAIARNGGTG